VTGKAVLLRLVGKNQALLLRINACDRTVMPRIDRKYLHNLKPIKPPLISRIGNKLTISTPVCSPRHPAAILSGKNDLGILES
ncbi:hypothetical protein, partial [Roseovarius aestuarii]|uniref:hypothetical protein n=1 Tax=Roseovarius aestuarii TaxID=475083 RepID=UPI001C3816A1